MSKQVELKVRESEKIRPPKSRENADWKANRKK